MKMSDISFEELLKLKEKLGSKAYNRCLTKDSQLSASVSKKFSRENKNRPREVSSKLQVRGVRNIIPVKTKVSRDPRFDERSGTFNEHYFRQSYSFLDDMKKKEKTVLQKSLKHEKDPLRKRKISALLRSMEDKEKAREEAEKRRAEEKLKRRKEQELVAEGKKPFYLKKSMKKKLQKEEKLKELQASGKMDKYLKRQSKKTLARDRKNMSFL